VRNGLSFPQWALVKNTAARLPPEDRAQFLTDLKARIKVTCTDDAVEIAIALALLHQQGETNEQNTTQNR
jgi:hypothetical protein